jgi:L-lactate utilization protein LutC
MSSEHKAALELGRQEGRAIRRYLEALEAHRPRRGRRRTAESVQKRLAAIEEQLPTTDALNRVQMMQERMDLQTELETRQAKVDLSALEHDFVKAAKGYSQRKGITYAAWREAGIDAAVLKKAGIGRGNTP